MTTRARSRRDLSWPVPATDLQDLDVIEIVQGDDGQVLWRVDERPAAAPVDCRETLLKRRHIDDEAGPLADEPDVAGDATVAPTSPTGEPEHAALPELAALLALTDMPDVPVVVQAAALVDDAPGRPDESTSALELITALQLREQFEFVDAPVLHVVGMPADVPPGVSAEGVTPAVPETPQPAATRETDRLPPVPASPPTFALAMSMEWPQVAEFVDSVPLPDASAAVLPCLPPSPPALAATAPPVPAFDEARLLDVFEPVPELEPRAEPRHAPVPAPLRWPAVFDAVPAWVAALRAVSARSCVEPVERLALVGCGMLMGVLFTIAGGPRGAAAPGVPVSDHGGQVAASVSASMSAERAGIGFVPERMVPARLTSTSLASPLPITIAAESVPRPDEAAAKASVPRPRPQASPAILGAIQRYAVAYNRQDARATTAVWPSADRQALVKAFSGLHEQRLTLLSCKTAVTGNHATASCYGTRRYRPRAGNSSTRVQQGQWRFGLQRSAGTWLIASVDAP